MFYSFFVWLETTPLSQLFHNEALYAFVDVIHMLGMVLFIGSIAVVTLRLLGLVMPKRPVSEVAGELRCGTAAGLLILFVTGPIVFLPEPVRWYTNGTFQVKMAVLLAALVFHFTLYRRVTRRDETGALLRAFTGIAALLLWFGVAWMGRLITVL